VSTDLGADARPAPPAPLAAPRPVPGPPPPYSPAEYGRRRRLVEDCAAEKGLDAVVVYGANRSGSGVPWLTGWPVTREAVLVMRPAERPVLLVGFHNHVPNAARVAVDCDVRPVGESAADTVKALLGGARRVGVVGGAPGPVRRAVGDVVELDAAYARWRAVKSAEELDQLRYAAWLTDRSAAALVEAAVPGATELDLVDAVESSYGGTGATNHIHYVAATSMAAPDRCVPGQWPTDRAVQAGSAVVFELSTAWGQDMPGQLLRTVTVESEPTPLYAELHALACDVHDAIVAQLRPGALPADLLAAADPVPAKGFLTVDDIVHGFGGGYLAPVLSHRGPPTGVHAQPLVAGMTLVVQPNVATPDLTAGVQTGELYEVTAAGARSLHAFPTGLLRGGTAL
jgi:Xaa-Pro dipeptidase